MDRRPGIRLTLTAAVLAACSSAPSPRGLGVRRAPGAARGLVATADGAWLAWLESCVETRAQSLPAGTASCDLRVVPAAGGDPELVARAVTTLPGAMAVSPAGAEVSALSGYDYATASGTLTRWRPGARPAELSSGVTFHGYGPDGALGYIAGGSLFLSLAGADPRPVEGVTAAASFELAPPGTELVALLRRRASAGGELLAVRKPPGATPASAVKVAGPVGDYQFGRGPRYAFTRLAPKGSELEVVEAKSPAEPEMVAEGVRAFAFSPVVDALAFLADALPGKQGNLRVRVGGRELALGNEVGEFRWAARSPRLAWLEEYDPRIRSGTLGVGGLDVARRTLGKNVSDFELSPDGRYVAYLQHTTRGGYSVDLLLAALDASDGAAPRLVAQSTYGFAFSPDGRSLYYRSRCTRSGEACDLERIATAEREKSPERIAEGMKSFEFDPREPGRILVSFKRLDRDALDLGVWEGGSLARVDTQVEPGSARFLAGDRVRVAYVVLDEKRPGVYVAELPGRAQ
ncbi:MAG TPA: hypothetical protein VMK42_10055 [Anaeromyxobacteraceae bacterium]|nr:hypothetical protein [Anaeromyxobacteraceae bacterium]